MIFPMPVHFLVFSLAVIAVADIHAAMARIENRWTTVHVLAGLAMAVLMATAYILGLVPMVLACSPHTH
jgi:pilus assembly protein TadC